MGATYLIDTNAISDYLGGSLPISGLDFMDEIMDNSPAISVVNRIELLGQNRPELSKFKIAVEGYFVFELTEEIILKTIALRKSRSIKVPDAIIAATALVNDLTIITHNTSDFKNIPSLKLLDLWHL
jgi:predicted nucleic acid-binding protein